MCFAPRLCSRDRTGTCLHLTQLLHSNPSNRINRCWGFYIPLTPAATLHTLFTPYSKDFHFYSEGSRMAVLPWNGKKFRYVNFVLESEPVAICYHPNCDAPFGTPLRSYIMMWEDWHNMFKADAAAKIYLCPDHAHNWPLVQNAFVGYFKTDTC